MKPHAPSARKFLLFAATALAAIALVPNQAQAVDESPLATAHQFSLGSANWRTAGDPSSITYSPDGTQLAAFSPDPVSNRGLIYVWDAVTGRRTTRFAADHENHRYSHLRFSSDGTRLISFAAKSWSIATGKGEQFKHSGIRALDITSDEQCMAVLKHDGRHDQVILWNRKSESSVIQFTFPRANPHAVSARFSPDDKTFCLRFPDGAAQLRATKDGTLVRTLLKSQPVGRFDGVIAPAFSPNGKWIALQVGVRIVIIDVTDGTTVETIETSTNAFASHIREIAWTPDSQRLAYSTSNLDQTIRVHEIRGRKTVARINDLSQFGSTLAFSPDGKRLAVGGATIRHIDTASWKEIDPTILHNRMPTKVVYSPNGDTVATKVCDDIILWDTATRKQRTVVATSSLANVRFSRDGKSLVAQTEAGVLSWDALTGEESFHHKPPVGWGILSPALDRKCRLVGTLLEMRNFDSGETLWSNPNAIEAAHAGSTTFCFSPDGGLVGVAAAGNAKTIRAPEPNLPSEKPIGSTESFRAAVSLWEAASGKLIGNLVAAEIDEHHRDLERSFHDGAFIDSVRDSMRWGPYNLLEFSPDGLFLAASRCPGEIDLWDILSRRLVGQIYAGEGPFAFSADGRTLLVVGIRRISLIETSTLQPVRRLTWRVDAIHSPQFQTWSDSHLVYPTFGLSPDGNSVALATRDAAPLEVYSLAPSRWKPERFNAKLTEAEATSLWQTLGEADGTAAYEAIWRLASAENGVELLDRQIGVAKLDETVNIRVAKLIADLASDNLRKRDAAFLALAQIPEHAESRLTRALEADPTPAVKVRIEELLELFKTHRLKLDRETVRSLRTVQILERHGGQTAVKILTRLANGKSMARESIAARAAIARIEQRTNREN